MADMTPLVLEIKANTSSATASIRKLKSEMSGLGRSMNVGPYGKGLRSIGKDAKWAGKQIGSALAAPMKNLTKNITNTVGAIGKLGAAFKRILFYRAIRSMIREIGDAFKYGVNNLYAWSSGVGGQFAASMNQIATAFAYFKNSVGAAVAPLINALAPAIDFVIDKAVTLLNVINQLFARLTGQTYWTRATKQATAYGGAVSAAGGAAKEAMRYLAPFDELNVLPDNSSGGGGGGSGGAGASGLFEDVVEFDQSINDLFELINNNKFFEAGQLLADKVGEIVDSLDAKITSADFRNKILGTLGNITKIINGFFYELTFEDGTAASIATRIGNLVGDAAGLALESIHTWLAGIDWSTIGVAIGQFVNGGIDALKNQNINLGQIIADLVNKQINLLSGFAKTVNWAGVGDWIAQNINSALNGIDWSKAITSLVDLATGILTAINNAIAGIDFKSVLTQIYNGLKNADWKGLWAQVKELVSNFGGLGAIALAITLLPELGAVAKTITQAMILKAVFGGGAGAAGASLGGLTIAAAGLMLEVPLAIGLVTTFTSTLNDEGYQNHTFGTAPLLSNWDIVDLVTSPAAWADTKIAAISSGVGNFGERIREALFGGGAAKDETPEASTGIPVTGSEEEYNSYFGLDNGASEAWKSWEVNENPVPVTLVPTGISYPSDWEEPKITSWGDIRDTITNKLTEGKRTISAWARYDSAKNGNLFSSGKNRLREISAWARYDSAKNGNLFSSGKDKLREISACARYDSAKNGSLFSAGKNRLREISAWARYDSRKDNLSAKDKTIATVASLAKMSYANSTVKGYLTNTYMTATVTSANFSWEAVYALQNKVRSVISTIFGKAAGGAFYGGKWHSIPQYAGGTTNAHGSLFLAGEAGPEVVGHVGGRTEVLNQSQLAAAVSAGVARAINSASFTVRSVASAPTYMQSDNGYDEDTLYRAFLRALNDAEISNDTYLDGEKIYDSTVRYNQRRTRMTGVNAMA